MAVQLTLSCDSEKTETGPVLIHSTGVEHYKIPPEVIHILQQSLTNDRLSDHADGVLCQEGSQRVLDILRQNGFTVENESTDDGKTSWTVVQNGGEHERSVHPEEPTPSADDENEAEAAEEDQVDEDAGGENKEEDEEEG